MKGFGSDAEFFWRNPRFVLPSVRAASSRRQTNAETRANLGARLEGSFADRPRRRRLLRLLRGLRLFSKATIDWAEARIGILGSKVGDPATLPPVYLAP